MAKLKMMKNIQTFVLLLSLGLGILPLATLAQTTPAASSIQQIDEAPAFVPRGVAIHELMDAFDLRKKNAKFIGQCLSHLDECFFVFTAMTRFDGVNLDPLRLYPDVSEAYTYADDIHLATMLGLVHGNIDVKGSPFYPRAYMTRIQALKVVMGAAELMDWREKFELVRDLGNEDALRSEKSLFTDVNALRDDSWWYPRYVNFALDVGIVDAAKEFRPDEPITEQAYNDMLRRALKKVATLKVV